MLPTTTTGWCFAPADNEEAFSKNIESFSDVIYRCRLNGGLRSVEKTPTLPKIPQFLVAGIMVEKWDYCRKLGKIRARTSVKHKCVIFYS